MKKLLGLLGTIMLTGNAIPSVIAAAPNRKHNIKKRQNNENISTTPKMQDNQNSELSTTSDSEFDIIEKEIILNENYSDNIQKMLQELIDENYIDPLRTLNMGGLLSTEIKNKKTIISKLEELEPKMAIWFKKTQIKKGNILILTLKNSNNESIKLVIRLKDFYILGFINKNQYFYFDDEILKRAKEKYPLINKEQINKLNNLSDKLNNLKENKLLFNEEKVKEYFQQKNELIPLKEKEKNIKRLNYNNELKLLKTKIDILSGNGEGLKKDEEELKSINSKAKERGNCQIKTNLGYTADYPEKGLDVILREKGKDIGKNIYISQNTLNEAIKNLSEINKDNIQSENIKHDLVRIIFITSEAMRFQCDEKTLEIFANIKNIDELEKIIADSRNILIDIQEKVFDKKESINWKDYTTQLRGDGTDNVGGWKKYSEQFNKFRIEIWEQLIKEKNINDFFYKNKYDINQILKIKKNDYIKEKIENLFKKSENQIFKKIKKDIKEYLEYIIKINFAQEFKTIWKSWKNFSLQLINPLFYKKHEEKLNQYLRKPIISIINSQIAILCYSIWKKNLDFIKLWIILNPNSEEINDYFLVDFSLLHQAISEGNNEIIREILKHPKINVNIQSMDGMNPLLMAVMNNNTEITKLLLENQKINVNIQNQNGSSALFWAVMNDNIEIIQLLFDHKADVNILDKWNYTPLHWAAKKGNIEIVKLLLANGANFNAKGILNITPMFITNHTTIKNILKEFAELKQKLYTIQNKTEKKEIETKIKELLGEAFVSILSIFVENHNLREISDNSKETILNAFIEKNKKLKKLFSIGQLYVTNITNDSAIINSPSPNTYTGTVPVTFTIKKEIQHNKSQKTIIENEYKKQGARPKGSEMIPNQPSNTDNSKASIGGGESSIGIQQQNTMYDVPADNSCLFWAVATAYLLPVRNNNEEFKNRFIKLFGEENLKDLQLIQKLLKQYNLENNRNLNQLWYQNQIANNLVTNVFRNRVVDYIRGNLDNPTQINSQINQIETFRSAIQISENEININNYLERMRQSSSWGGQLEILAIGNLLGSNINVNNRNIFETNNPNVNLRIFHVNENHYNFILLQNTNEENIINSQEKTTDIQNQQKLVEEEQTKTNTVIPNKATESNGTKVSVVNKSINKNIENLQTTTMKAIKKYNALSKEEKKQKLNEINQHYKNQSDNGKQKFKDELKLIGTSVIGAGIVAVGTKITVGGSVSSAAVSTGETLEMKSLLSEESLTAAETLSVTEGTAALATEGAVIGAEAGTAAALAPETLGLSLVIGGLAIAGTAIIWWLSSHDNNTQAVKHESHNQYNEIEKYYKFLAHDQLKLDININEWNKIKQIYQENSNNYQEFKNKIKSEINNFHKEDHSGWGGSISDDINILIEIIFNHFQEIKNHFLSNPNHGWKIITNTIGSYFIIEEE